MEWSVWKLFKWRPNPKISIATDALCESHNCGACLEINEKEKENIESLENKSMCHLRTINFWKDRTTQKKECEEITKLW
jgi:hypothetical protein